MCALLYSPIPLDSTTGVNDAAYGHQPARIRFSSELGRCLPWLENTSMSSNLRTYCVDRDQVVEAVLSPPYMLGLVPTRRSQSECP